MSNRNLKVLKRGHEKALLMINAQIGQLCQRLAIECLKGAVDAYDADTRTRNLTGNTRTSFASAVYYNGRMTSVYTVFNTGESIPKPTNGMVEVGDKDFQVYGRTFMVFKVREYNAKHRAMGWFFQPTIHGAYAYDLTTQFLGRHRPDTKDWTVVVASASPYGEFLKNVRKFDILDSQSTGGELAKHVVDAIARIGDIDSFKSVAKR